MNNVLDTAVQANVVGADKNAIVVAPQFFSTKFNSGVSTSGPFSLCDNSRLNQIMLIYRFDLFFLSL